jgi:secreted PhoX family phosphatase
MDDPQHTRRVAASRRAFLTGSAAVAAGAVGSQLAPATASAEGRDHDDDVTSDQWPSGNVIFGVRAVDRAGHRSPATFPFPKPA